MENKTKMEINKAELETIKIEILEFGFKKILKENIKKNFFYN